MTDPEPDLANLLFAVADEDEAAFARLYDLTSSKLFAIALRILGNRALAEDVLQDVYIKIWRGAGKFDTKRGSAEGWMSVMTRNQAIDLLRRTGRRQLAHEQNADTEFGSVAGSGQLLDRLDIVRGLAELDAAPRDLVLRAYIEGRSREELAQLYDRPVGTIKTWLRTALAQLRDALERDAQ